MSRKLTKEIIYNRIGTDKLDSIKTLNLWGNNLDDITLLSEMPYLEILSLSNNQIKDIKSLKNLKNLKELYLKENNISDFSQLEFLKNCKKLEILNLSENPITSQQNYRQKILDMLPNLKKLDDIENNTFQHSKFSFHKNPFMLFKKIFPKRVNKINNNKINDLNANLDLSLDYSKNNFKIIDPNKSTCFEEMNNNKYNKKIVGNYKPFSHMKNYQSTMLSYQEFDEPIKNEKKEKNLFENKKEENKDKIKINEDVVIQSIKLLIGVLNTSELNVVNDVIKKMINEKNI